MPAASSRLLRGLAVSLTGFVSATALFGGVELLTGWPRRQPTEWLAGTPFDSYAVPGLLLAGLVGGSNAVAAWATARRSPRWPELTTAAGVVLLGWIAAEVALLDQPEAPTPIEWTYAGIGALTATLGGLAWAGRPGD